MDKYSELIMKRKNILSEISFLSFDDNVKRYIELCKENDELKSIINNLYIDRCIEKYENCHHVYVTCGYTTDGDYDSSSIAYKGCIKCGLTTKAYNTNSIMNRFFKKHPLEYDIDRMPGMQIGNKFTYVDLNTAKDMYKSIIKNYPEISDEMLVKVFTRWLSKYEDNSNKKLYLH